MSAGEYDGQHGFKAQSFLARMVKDGASFAPHSREQIAQNAYHFVKRLNSVRVMKGDSDSAELDRERTYQLRFEELASNRGIHHLPEGFTIRLNKRTCEAELYCGRRKYTPAQPSSS